MYEIVGMLSCVYIPFARYCTDHFEIVFSLQGNCQFAARFAAKFVLQKSQKKLRQLAVNDILFYREILPRLYHDFVARFAANLLRIYRKIYR
jgi:hypothetical protein